MPASDSVTEPCVTLIVASLSPASALDIGIGMGKFGFIFRQVREWDNMTTDISRASKENWQSRLDGIEACSQYITPLQKYLYDQIFIGLAQEIERRLENYDLIHLGDVIEHLEKSEGQRLLDTLFKKARLGILIVTPVGKYEQKGTKDNPYEEHKSVWSPADLRRFPCVRAKKVAKRQWVIFISRNKHWFRDPLVSGISRTKRERLKRVVKLLFGEKGLNLLSKIKKILRR